MDIADGDPQVETKSGTNGCWSLVLFVVWVLAVMLAIVGPLFGINTWWMMTWAFPGLGTLLLLLGIHLAFAAVLIWWLSKRGVTPVANDTVLDVVTWPLGKQILFAFIGAGVFEELIFRWAVPMAVMMAALWLGMPIYWAVILGFVLGGVWFAVLHSSMTASMIVAGLAAFTTTLVVMIWGLPAAMLFHGAYDAILLTVSHIAKKRQQQ